MPRLGAFGRATRSGRRMKAIRAALLIALLAPEPDSGIVLRPGWR